MNDTLLKELTDYLDSLQHVRADEIPDLDLYMDQVTAFMERHLAPLKRDPSDKVLTKTMINNYTKNRLLPSPDRKHYSKRHMLMLLFIYYYKSILSLSDLETVMNPLKESFASKDAEPLLSKVYEELFSRESEAKTTLEKDLGEMFRRSEASFSEKDFPELSDEDRKNLHLFAFLGEMGYDIFLKKLCMERIIDQMKSEEESGSQQSGK